KASWNGATGGYPAVIRRADGEFLGECGCGVLTSQAAPDEIRGELEIGWQLRADRWGHGYATEAARAVLGLVFSQLGPSLIYSQTSEANWRSWRVMERLGMERMAHLDYDGPLYPPEENPTKVYRLTRDEWERRAGWAARWVLLAGGCLPPRSSPAVSCCFWSSRWWRAWRCLAWAALPTSGTARCWCTRPCCSAATRTRT